MSLISSLNIAQQALVVNQAALNVVSNNISNVNTEGYSRQRINLTPGVNYTPLGGSTTDQAYSSCGVEISSVQRYADSYLQSYFRQQNTANSYLNQYSEVSANIEGLTNELKGAGLEQAFTNFFEAAQTLSLNPKDATARQNYMQQSQTIALKFNDLSGNFTDIRSSLVGDISVPGSIDTSKIAGMVSESNNLMEQIAKINSDIVRMSASDIAPSSLLDKRDLLVDKLSVLIPVTVTDNTNGTINLSLNGLDMINGTEQVASLSLEAGNTVDTPAILKLKNADGAITSKVINQFVNSGKIGALLDIGGPSTANKLTVKGVMDSYDKLANGFATIINNIQTQLSPSGSPMAIDALTNQLKPATENIFESKDGTAITAGNIQINNNVMTDPFLIAVARVNPLDYDPNGIGNNSNMLQVLQARSANASELDNVSPESALANIVGGIGLKNANLKNNVENQGAVLKQANAQLTSVKGVNIDEELIDLTKYQTAYKASSRIYTVCNELLDLLINLGR